MVETETRLLSRLTALPLPGRLVGLDLGGVETVNSVLTEDTLINVWFWCAVRKRERDSRVFVLLLHVYVCVYVCMCA